MKRQTLCKKSSSKLGEWKSITIWVRRQFSTPHESLEPEVKFNIASAIGGCIEGIGASREEERLDSEVKVRCEVTKNPVSKERKNIHKKTQTVQGNVDVLTKVKVFWIEK